MVVGTPSGTRILTCVMQTIFNYIEYEMPLYDAVAALRYHHQWSPDYIRVEESDFDKNTRSELLGLGYDIEKNLGCRKAVAREDKTLVGVSDLEVRG